MNSRHSVLTSPDPTRAAIVFRRRPGVSESFLPGIPDDAPDA